MTMFFMLSGFSLFVNWGGISLSEPNQITRFWKKRFFGIVPMYWISSLIYVVLMIAIRKDTIKDEILLFPIEILGLQSCFASLFGFSHNGGTWFISCILICYITYPFLQELIKTIKKRTKIVMLMICSALLLYSPIVVHIYKLQRIYSNPFFRLLEFAIGMILASMKTDYKDSKIMGYLYKWPAIIIASSVMVVGISLVVKLKIAISNYMVYSWICLPCFIVMLLGLSGIEFIALRNSKILKWLADVSFVFLLAQLYSNTVSKMIIGRYSIDSNLCKIMIGWISCIVFALVLRMIEKGINRKMESLIRYDSRKKSDK